MFLNLLLIIFSHQFIGEALIGTLQDGLKEEFTEKVKKSWLKLFSILVTQMKIGMRQAEADDTKNENDIKANKNQENANKPKTSK